MGDFHIRRFGRADAQQAVACLDALLPESWRDGPPADAAQVARALDHPGFILLVAATSDNWPAGYVSGTITPKLNGQGDLAFLDDLFVTADHRGCGLGRELTRAFRSVVLAEATRPVSMWGATAIDNDACDGAFRASGARPDGEVFREYNWPVVGGNTP